MDVRDLFSVILVMLGHPHTGEEVGRSKKSRRRSRSSRIQEQRESMTQEQNSRCRGLSRNQEWNLAG